jgi:CRISPR-associated protein Csb3
MTEGIALPGDVRVAFDHLVAYGAAAIARQQGERQTALEWSGGIEPRIHLHGVCLHDLASMINRHAADHTAPDSWVMADLEVEPVWQAKQGSGKAVTTALFSPRVLGLNRLGVPVWRDARYACLDRLTSEDYLDCALIGALGEPSYWSERDGRDNPDLGASRWEMKTRNRGEEFVGHRLRKVAEAVAHMKDGEVAGGLAGRTITDRVGKGASDSRTPTGLKPPAPTDNARAWCAFWGLSLMGVVHRASGASSTTAHFGNHRDGYFYLPVMTRPWPLGRLRTVLRSPELLAAASAGLRSGLPARELGAGKKSLVGPVPAWAWLTARGASAVVRFPVHRSNNVNAPEKWAERGQVIEAGDSQ